LTEDATHRLRPKLRPADGEPRSPLRRLWNEADQKWYFASVDVVGVLTDSVDAGAYWRKLKERLKKEGNETVTNCHALKNNRR
jgi:hypothetical protein